MRVRERIFVSVERADDRDSCAFVDPKNQRKQRRKKHERARSNIETRSIESDDVVFSADRVLRVRLFFLKNGKREVLGSRCPILLSSTAELFVAVVLE